MRRSTWRYLPPILIHLVASLLSDLPWLNYSLPFGQSIHWTAFTFHPLYYVEMAAWIIIALVGVIRFGRKAIFDLIMLLGAVATTALILVDIFPSVLLTALAIGEGLIVAIRQRKGWAPAVALLLIGVGGVTILDVPQAETVNLPGTIVMMDKVVQMEGGQPTGKILGLTVESRPAALLHLWLADPLWTFLSPEEATAKDSRITPVFLQEAHEAGLAIGLKYAGRGGDAKLESGFLVYSLVPGGPADGKIKPGDHVTKIGGRSPKDWAEAVQVIRSYKPGETVPFTLVRESKELTIEIKLGTNPTDPNVPMVGLEGKDAWLYTIPVGHQTTDLVAGNSYGSVFALTVVDQLTPGGITNGNVVIGTGTIDGNGKIGEVGGVPLKAYLATVSEADVLFVPASQLAEAQRGATSEDAAILAPQEVAPRKGAQGKLTIVPVTEFQQILDWLRAHPKQ